MFLFISYLEHACVSIEYKCLRHRKISARKLHGAAESAGQYRSANFGMAGGVKFWIASQRVADVKRGNELWLQELNINVTERVNYLTILFTGLSALN